MNARLTQKAPAKVNLTLRVTGRRPDGYHTLESLFAFADLADELSFEPAQSLALDVRGPFAAVCGPTSQNLVIRAAAALAERVLALKLGRFTLEKNIPVAAGLGGGSADAAAALRLLAKANGVAPDDARLLAAAAATGADVPACLDSRARIVSGIGDELSAPVALPELPAVLVNPRIPLPTAQVFANFELADMSKRPARGIPADRTAALEWLSRHANDLTEAATARLPLIDEMLMTLKAEPGCRIARMSGSGATCFGLFETQPGAQAAADKIRAAQPQWWVHAGVLR